ncbi:protein of unknown function [Micropruina glycogenica]|uniref:Uncharacterized protein n=1 Tax=Micropruina glycogenica TaxID=75385 RepID=A0A2N9JDE0_9ACTN|nr:protein of unknown function [Micropruina glycogenica]
MYGQARIERGSPMAQFQSALSGLLTSVHNGEGVDLVRESVRMVLQELIDAEAIAVIGADPLRTHPRAHQRTQRHPPPGGDDQGRHRRSADPEATHRLVLPIGARVAAPWLRSCSSALS